MRVPEKPEKGKVDITPVMRTTVGLSSDGHAVTAPKPLSDEELAAVRSAYEDGCDIDLSLVFDELVKLRRDNALRLVGPPTFVHCPDGSVQFSDDQRSDEIDRLRARLATVEKEYADVAEAIGIAYVADHCAVVPGPVDRILQEVREMKRAEGLVHDLRARNRQLFLAIEAALYADSPSEADEILLDAMKENDDGK